MAFLLHWSATREQQESSQQQDQQETIRRTGPGMLVSNRLHVREKSSETDHTCPGQLLILLVHHAHGFEPVGSCWSFLRNKVCKFTRRWEFFLCESWKKHGEQYRIWEAERCTTSGRSAFGIGRTRVRDEAEPLHDEALSGGGAIFFVVTCLRNCHRLRSSLPPGGRNIGISCGWVLRCSVNVLASLTTFIRRA